MMTELTWREADVRLLEWEFKHIHPRPAVQCINDGGMRGMMKKKKINHMAHLFYNGDSQSFSNCTQRNSLAPNRDTNYPATGSCRVTCHSVSVWNIAPPPAASSSRQEGRWSPGSCPQHGWRFAPRGWLASPWLCKNMEETFKYEYLHCKRQRTGDFI